MLDQWAVFLTFILVLVSSHPVVCYLTMLIYALEEVNARLRAQSRYQSSMPEDFIQLIQTDFNKIFRKVSTSYLLVRCPRL